MTFEEFDFLRSDEGRRAVQENLAADPVAVAMRYRGPFAAAVATQVKYLQRAGGRGGAGDGVGSEVGAGAKLPSYFRAGCIIPSLAFEQSSAEAVAAARTYSGGLCIDLTCGLGVDAFCLSRRFGRVVAVERDPLLAAVARYNFSLLGADNIEVIEGSAEEFLAALAGEADVAATSRAATQDCAVPGGADCGVRSVAFASLALLLRASAVQASSTALGLASFRPGLTACAAQALAAPFSLSPLSATTLTAGGPLADLIFVDPDRRGASGEKLYKLEDCSPDVVSLMPLTRSLAEVVAVKCSPLFDVDRARALFGEGTLCEAVSWGGECKEVLIETGGRRVGEHIADERLAVPRAVPRAVSRIRATAVGRGSVVFDAARPTAVAPPLPDFLSVALSGAPLTTSGTLYLTIPDVALQKARCAAEYFSGLGAFIESDNGFALHSAILDTKLGRSLKVVSIERFSPKKISKKLRDRGIRGIDILVRDFPLTAATIARQLGVREGGVATFVFTRLAGEAVCIEVEKL